MARRLINSKLIGRTRIKKISASKRITATHAKNARCSLPSFFSPNWISHTELSGTSAGNPVRK